MEQVLERSFHDQQIAHQDQGMLFHVNVLALHLDDGEAALGVCLFDVVLEQGTGVAGVFGDELGFMDMA